MRKRVLLVMALVMALSTVAPAASFWGGLLNSAFSWGSAGDSSSNSGWNSNSAGYQNAEVQGSPFGVGYVGQAAGAAGFQNSSMTSQQQGAIAGMGQTVGAANGSSATGFQTGSVYDTQSGPWGTQSYLISGTQFGSVNTTYGGAATTTQTSVVTVYQSQGNGVSPP